MDSGWQPANDLERDLLAAVDADDGKRYAELLGSSVLYVPTIDGLAAVFTSPFSLFWGLGSLATGYEEYDLAALRRRHPDPDQPLAVNPGVPIGVLLTLRDLDGMGSGRVGLAKVEDVPADATDRAQAEIRDMCLTQLGGDEAMAAAALDEDSANELELKLIDSTETLEFDSFINALTNSTVIVVTSRPVAGAHEIQGIGFPWLVAEHTDGRRAIPLFSSATTLEKATTARTQWVEVPFMDVAANWPGSGHILCLNPGTAFELTLPGDSVRQLLQTASGAPTEGHVASCACRLRAVGDDSTVSGSG
jgi:hypothetical protein